MTDPTSTPTTNAETLAEALRPFAELYRVLTLYRSGKEDIVREFDDSMVLKRWCHVELERDINECFNLEWGHLRRAAAALAARPAAASVPVPRDLAERVGEAKPEALHLRELDPGRSGYIWCVWSDADRAYVPYRPDASASVPRDLAERVGEAGTLENIAFLKRLAKEKREDARGYMDHENGPYDGAALVCRDDSKRLLQIAAALSSVPPGASPGPAETFATYQQRATDWAYECFRPECVTDRVERGLRFAEEAMELAQSVGVPHAKARQVVDYVYGRPVEADPSKEVGGTLVTLAVLCHTARVDMAKAAEAGLAYCIQNTARIRQKHEEKHARGLVSADDVTRDIPSPAAPETPAAQAEGK